ncbi:MAG TPA: penicillin acylase family protein [Blastocatellia bacterium]|nr:penicillin acylase family protein [Blastocatellia bacterium]HMV84944.1 penicillin acylase family protein [Blastocatellia bacterium]HMX25920.1 penicillin acylase family protein [Blastocatellia bacterium]HMZ16886.1 penicillin acylase family protein [Blastocatellia bacterium]HNG32121.1 penicillin acylase family protein [Blastocatellia bacterium]
MTRKLIRLSLLILAYVFLPVATSSPSAQLPQSPQALKLAGLKDKVTVRRDERGIPYIEAANEHDLYFAQGYVVAGDRLWQMDLLRRTARGELSEIFGRVALDEDKRRRTYGFAQVSEKVAANVAGEAKVTLDALVNGINAFIASCEEKDLPPEFRILKYKPRPWTAADSVVIGLLMHESLSTTWQTDVMRAAMAALPQAQREALLMEFTAMDTPVVGSDNVKAKASAMKAANAPKVSDELLKLAMADEALRQRSAERVGFGAEDLAASNNWVVSGKRTASGKPLLANDPHLAGSVPSIWYLIHLSAPGIRVAGVTIPGVNAVVIGHNDRIAWGMTNLGPDVQDVYSEKFDPANPKRYQTPSGWKEAETRREEIKVRKSPADPETETVAHEVTVTRHGPVVLQRGDEKYALRWTALDTSREMVTTFFKLSRAREWKDFTAAISTFAGATQNFIFADVDGHIGYYGAGYIPIRKSGDGSLPYDGATDDGEWTGYIPFDKLPHVFDPPSGMIVTANARIVGKDYPYHLTHAWSAPYRQKRINDLLKAKQKLTIDDFRATQGDTYAIGGATFAREIVKLFNNDAGADEKLKASLKLLSDWDGRVTSDSRAALLIHEMRDIFANRVVSAAIGEDKAKQYRWTNRHALMDKIVTEWPAAWLPKSHSEGANWKDFVKSCHDAARANLAQRLGNDESKWTFGQAVQVRFNHPLTAAPLVGNQFKIEPFPQTGNGYVGGLGPTVNVGPTVSMRLIADPSNWDNSQHGITLGESGHPQSPHYKDQLDDWRNVTPRAFPFSAAAVSKAAKSVTVLMP